MPTRLKANYLLGGLLAPLLVLAVLAGCVGRPEHVGPDPSTSVETTNTAAAGQDAEPDQDPDTDADVTDEGDSEEEGSEGRDDSAQGSASTASGRSGTSSSGSNSGTGGGSGGSSGSSSSSANSGTGTGSQSSSSQGSGSSGGQSGGSTSQSTAPQTITVSIEIEARTAHASNPAALAGISHNGGVILARRNVTVPAGASVRDALNATGVRVNASGALVTGIGGLSMNDFGNQSGWMFSVNGQFPNTSANAKRLNAGDSVAWRYTLNNGADLGASW